MSSALETISGVFERCIYTPPDGDSPFRIAVLTDGTSLKGNVDPTDPPVAGHRYSFSGVWEKEGYQGRSPAFRFRSYVESEPLTRTEIVAYLTRKLRGTGVSYGIASRLYDAFGEKAVETLRNTPDDAASHPFLQRHLEPDVARSAAAILLKLRATSEVEMKLIGLLDKKHFPHGLPKECIKRWGIRAAARVKHDPFALLVAGFGGCGFARCDNLYRELGCNLHRLKRQAICLWHAVSELCERTGDTWIKAGNAIDLMKQRVGGTVVKPEQAMKLATHRTVGILTLYRDPSGVWWIAESDKARQERSLATKILELMAWVPPAEIDVDQVGENGIQRLDVTEEMVEEMLRESTDREFDIAGLVRDGKESGICQFCGRELTNDESKRRGYGPVCAARWGLPYGDESDGGDIRATTDSSRSDTSGNPPSLRTDPTRMVGV